MLDGERCRGKVDRWDAVPVVQDAQQIADVWPLLRVRDKTEADEVLHFVGGKLVSGEVVVCIHDC